MENQFLSDVSLTNDEVPSNFSQLDFGILSQALDELGITNWSKIVGNCYEGIEWIGEPSITKEELEEKIEDIRPNLPMKILRQERDVKISQTDWWVLPDRTPTPEQLAYRQALRDLPENVTPVLTEDKTGITGFDWPVMP